MSKIPAQLRDKAVVSKEIELAFLSSILISPDKFASIASSGMDGGFMCYPDCAEVLSVALEIFAVRGSVSSTAVLAELLERKPGMTTDHAAYNTHHLVDDHMLADHMDRIWGAYRIRSYYALIRESEDNVLKPGLSILQREKAINESLGKMLSFMPESESMYLDARQFAMYAAECVKLTEDGKKAMRQKSGIVSLDANFGGWPVARVSVIGGRTSHGKTMFATYAAVQLCRKLAKLGERGQVLYFSAEMSHDEMSYRILSCLSGVSSEKIGHNICTDNEKQKVREALEEMLTTIRIAVDTHPEPTTAHMMSRAASANAQMPVRMIIFDYLEYTGEKDRSEELKLSKALKGCHAIAKRIGCPFIVLSQLSRAVDTRERPTIGDFRYSGFIEQVASLAMIVYWPWKHNRQRAREETPIEDANHYELLVLKNTNGRTGKISMRFYGETGTFIDPYAEKAFKGEVMR